MDVNTAIEIQVLKKRVGVIAVKILLALMLVKWLLTTSPFSTKFLTFLLLYGLISIFGFFVNMTGNYIIGAIVGIAALVFFFSFFEKTNTFIQAIASLAFFGGGIIYDVKSMLKLYKLTKSSTPKTETLDDNQKAS